MNPSHAFVTGIVCIALVGLTACLSTAPAPSPLATPTSLPTSTPIAPPIPLPTFTSAATLAPPPTWTVPSPDTVISRGPYLQSVTTSTIIVVWQTDQPSQGEVVYGETQDYDSIATDSTMDTRHVVTLTGLEPYTAYHYRIESSGAPLSTDFAFRTAAGPDQTRFTFAVLGDTQTQHQIHQEVVNRIVLLEPDFVLHTGDLVAMGSIVSLWEIFFEVERELMARVPIFPTLGNHEIDYPHYFDLFHLPGNERWYSFDYGNARFVCLQVDGIADYGPQSEQFAWLEETLAANTQPWLFVTFHIPPYSSSIDAREGAIRRTLTPLFEQYGVDVVFNGHHHNYERNEVNDVTYVVTGGGGGTLSVMEEREPTRAAFAVAHHCVLLEIDGQHLQATVISHKGKVLDTFERSTE